MRRPRASLWRRKGECAGGSRMSESLAVRMAGSSVTPISDGAALSRGSTAITRVHEVLDALAARDVHGEILTAIRLGKAIRQLYTHQPPAPEALHAGHTI